MSSGSTASGASLIERISPAPDISTVTTPPPALPVTTSSAARACAENASWADSSNPPRSPSSDRAPGWGWLGTGGSDGVSAIGSVLLDELAAAERAHDQVHVRDHGIVGVP